MTAHRGLDRRAALRVGDRVRYDGQEQAVIGLSGTLVRLHGDDGTESVLALVRLQAANDFAVLTGEGAPSLPGLGLLAAVSPAALKRAQWWERHILEIETGMRSEDPTRLPESSTTRFAPRWSSASWRRSTNSPRWARR